MGLFGIIMKKDSGQLRTLSEKEIQDKLYGSFRVNQELTHELPSESKHGSSTPTMIQDSAPESQDLFQQPPAQKIEPLRLGEDRIRASLDKKKEGMRLAAAKFKEWADEEIETATSAVQLGWKEEKKKARHATNPPRHYPKPEVGEIIRTLAGRVTEFFSFLINKMGGAIRALVSQLTSVKQRGYWASGFAIFLLLISVHFLNVRHEAAMKLPRLSRPARSLPKNTEPAVNFLVTTAKEAIVGSSPLSPVSKTGEEQSVAPASIINDSERLPFVIQVCTYAAEEDATRLVERVHRENLSAFVKKSKRAGGKTYYSVFVGRFKDYSEAQKILAQFRKKEISRNFQDAFIRTL